MAEINLYVLTEVLAMERDYVSKELGRWRALCPWSSCGMISTGKTPKDSEINLSTTNPTWTDLGANLSSRSKKPVTNRLSYGTAFSLKLLEAMKIHRINSTFFYEICRFVC
jgi:hypothetical protein